MEGEENVDVWYVPGETGGGFLHHCEAVAAHEILLLELSRWVGVWRRKRVEVRS